MIIDYQVIEALSKEFLKSGGTRYFSGELIAAEDTKIGTAASPVEELYVRNLYSEFMTAPGSSADTVDGFHAASTPAPGVLLALDVDGKFPDEVITFPTTWGGGILTGDLSVVPTLTIDGVDISVFKTDFDAHEDLGASEAHSYIGQHDHLTPDNGGDLLQYASTDGSGSRVAYMSARLNKSLVPGLGLTGGGVFDKDLRVDLFVGDGIEITSDNRVALRAPGTLSISSTNSSETNHTHAITASSDPTGVSLLSSNADAGIRLNRIGVGSVEIPGAGNISASGDVAGSQVISEQDMFVGSNLYVGEGVLRTEKLQGSVVLNGASGQYPGALMIKTADASQRGVVLQASSGQEVTASLLTFIDDSGYRVLDVRHNGTLESGNPSFVSGVSGWRITGDGDAEFKNITARGELHTTVLVANEMHAAGGTMAVMPTGIVDSPISAGDNVIGTTFNLIVSGDPNVPGSSPFALNDVLRLKLQTGL